LPTALYERLAEVLATLHRQELPAVPERAIELPGRGGLEEALDDLGDQWSGGPYSEPARDLLDRMASAPQVITHGEPHPGNIVRTGAGLMLVDWDTVGLAPRTAAHREPDKPGDSYANDREYELPTWVLMMLEGEHHEQHDQL
jgi:aminoglycoside phosphotransferase (APT) family kinase protein